MFSSSNPSPSSIHGFPSPFLGQEKDGLYFNHHPFGDYSSFDHATTPPAVKELGLQNSENHNNHLKNLVDSVISPSRKRVAASSKKDRHSKIFTAQGPRDRRVRLSIDISKKFFGLQDLLGFDKASKTLDWLFTKSKTAIKDLVEEMKHTSSSTLSDQCEEVFMEKGDHHHLDKKGKKKKPVVKHINGGKKKKPITQKHKSGFHVSLEARSQLRAEARSRARERTIEKMRIKNKNVVGDHQNYCYLQSSCENQIQSPSNHEEVKIGESLTTEQKLPKPYSLIYNSQNNYVDSKDSSSQFKMRTH